MSLKIQKKLRFIPVINLISLFCYGKLTWRVSVKMSDHISTIFKMFGILILINFPRLLLLDVCKNEMVNTVILWVSAYLSSLTVSLVSIEGQEKILGKDEKEHQSNTINNCDETNNASAEEDKDHSQIQENEAHSSPKKEPFISLRTQKIIRFIPVINILTFFAYINLAMATPMKDRGYAKLILKAFAFFALISAFRLVIIYCVENELINVIARWLSIYLYFLTMALLFVKEQEKIISRENRVK